MPLFPKTHPTTQLHRHAQEGSINEDRQTALQESNVLEQLFSGPAKKNDKTFREIIEENREKRR